MQQNPQSINQMMQQLGWQQTTPAVGYRCSFQLNQSGILWHSNMRLLYRHRHKGVTVDDTIRYRTNEGLRVQLKSPIDMNSKLLLTSLASVKWMRWLLDKGLKIRGFKKYPNQIGTLSIYHQDSRLVKRLFGKEAFIQVAEPLIESPNLVSWELSLIPGEVTYNLTLNHCSELTAELFNKLFNDCQKISDTLLKAAQFLS